MSEGYEFLEDGRHVRRRPGVGAGLCAPRTACAMPCSDMLPVYPAALTMAATSTVVLIMTPGKRFFSAETSCATVTPIFSIVDPRKRANEAYSEGHSCTEKISVFFTRLDWPD